MNADLEIAFEIVNVEGLQGDLDDAPLAAVLATLSADQRSGVLRVGNGGELWMNNGRLYLAATGDGADVASVLFGAGIASLEAIEEQLKTSTDVAGSLADSDSAGAPVLERLLHEHNLTGLFEHLVPSGGTWEFIEGETHPVGARFSEDTADLLAQAERRLDIWKQIAARIPSTNVAFRLSKSLPDAGEERVVTADEWRYLALLDSHRTVADVINETGESAFRVCSSLYRLLLEELIEEVV